MIIRVTINQTRLNIPGISPDPRGVMLGQRGLLLLPTIERLVSYFRVYGDQDSIDELLPTLKISQVKTQLQTREFILSFAVASSYQMDRCAGIAKMLGGLAFTGTSRHFVKYRDASSPLGYDTDTLMSTGGDFALYHDDFSQTYEEDREIQFKNLVLQLSPQRAEVARDEFDNELFFAVRPGLVGAVQGYLFRNGANARAALAEWPSKSAFDDGPRRLYLFKCKDLPPRIPALMQATPGVDVYEPMGENVAVEHGYAHPIHLPSCLSIFGEGSLYLFSGSRDEVDIVAPLPEFADIRHLSSLSVRLGGSQSPHGGGKRTEQTIEVPLKLVPVSEPWKRIRAVLIPWSRAEWLKKLIYSLPPKIIEETMIHVSPDHIVVMGEAGVETIPLGTLLCAASDSVLVAAGYGFLPQVSPDLLSDLIGINPGEIAVFEPSYNQPFILKKSDFKVLGKGAVTSLLSKQIQSVESQQDTSTTPMLNYDHLGPFPLWGLPGRKAKGEEN